MLRVEVERVRLEIDLTPGASVAPQVFAAIDTDHDGQIARAEADTYAREVLRKLGAARGFGPDFAARVEQNAVSLEENSNAVLARIRLAEADAAIVYASDIRAADTALRVVPIPPAYNVTARYSIAVLRAGAHAPPARAFAALAVGAQGQAILVRHGFLAADTSAP